MGRFDATKATIDANIKSNGNQEITGDILNSVMKDMVDATDAELTQLSRKTSVSIDAIDKKVDTLALGKFYGFYLTEADLPNGNFPGYAYVGASSPFSVYNYDGTTWVDSGVKEERGEGQIVYLEDMSGYDLTLNPTEMRLFLQSAIDYAAANKAMLIFPKGKTFVIDIPEANTTIYDCEGGDGLSVPANIVIDFNYSTIKAETNHWWSYNIICIPVTSENVTLMNGIVIGERDTHVMSNTISSNTKGTTDEWNYAIGVKGKGNVKLINMDCSNVRGDGINIEGEYTHNHPIPVKDDKILLGKDVDATGNIVADESSISTDLLTLSSYYTITANEYGIETFLAPRSATDRHNANIDESRYLKISYYTEFDSFISQETIKMGDIMTIPSSAAKFRVSQVVGDLNDTHVFWIGNLLWNLNSTISVCKVHDCGRNGIVATSVRFLNIEKCVITNIFGTNNGVGIDIEGLSYVQRDITIDSCLIDNKGHNGIILAQGQHMIIKNCSLVGCSIVSNVFDSHIHNCEATHIHQKVDLNVVYDNDLVYPRSTIKDCVVGELLASYADVENCHVEGACSSSIEHRLTEKLEPVFKGCKFKQAINGIVTFENCVLKSTDTLACQPNAGLLTFKNCEIDVPVIKSSASGMMRFIGCKLTTSVAESYVFRICTDTFVDNILVTTSANSSSKCHLELTGDYCEVVGNTYEGEYFYGAFWLDTNASKGSPRKVTIADNIFKSEVSMDCILFRLASGLRNAKIYCSNNAALAKWQTITDFALPTDLTESDTLLIYDMGTMSETNLTQLQDARIKRPTLQ